MTYVHLTVMKRSPSSHSSSSSDNAHTAKRPRTEQGLFSGLVIHIIQSKMGVTERDLLCSLAESKGARVQSNIQHADVIVTRISTHKGLEGYIKPKLAVCPFQYIRLLEVSVWLETEGYRYSILDHPVCCYSETFAVRRLQCNLYC